MPTNPEWFVLTGQDARGLQEYGLLNPNHEPGYHKLHKSCFFRHDDISDVLLESSPKPCDMLTVPEILCSRKALIWLGFSDQAADRLWKKWQGRKKPKSLPDVVVFRDTIFAHFRSPNPALKTVSDEDNRWRQVLHDHGLSSFVGMIMDPRFSAQRLTESCKYWVEDILRQRWDLLTKIYEVSRKRTAQIWENHVWDIPASLPANSSKLDLFKAR